MKECVDELILKEQKDIIVDIAEHYFKEYVKKSGDVDDFLIDLTQKAFEQGSEDRRYNFILAVIKFVGKDTERLLWLLAWAYQEHGQHLKAYTYFVACDEPQEVISLLDKHIIEKGYKTERDFFILRAIFDFLII